MSRTRNLKIILLAIFMLLIQISTSVDAVAQDNSSAFNVLIVNSYQIGHRWEAEVVKGFKEAAEAYGKKEINVKLEYFDFKNGNDEEYAASFIELIEKKYPKGSIDAICTIGDEAFSVISPQITKASSELNEIPLFFSGVDSHINLTSVEREYMTGLYQRNSILETLNLILQLDNEIKTINIITEDSGFGNRLINDAINIVDNYFKREISINVYQSNYLEDILSEMKEKQINPKASKCKEVIILAGEFQDKTTGAFIDLNETVNKIKENSPWPIYTSDEAYLSASVLGGCVDTGKLHGMAIFNRLKRVIEGDKVSEINCVFTPSPKWVLKYDEIYNYGININNIPRKCEIMDQKFYQPLWPVEMKIVILSLIITAVFFLVYFIGYILYARRELKKQREETKFRIAREKLQTDFVVNISHELRTPINIILSGTSVMKLQLDKPQEELDKGYLEEKLHIISENAYRLLKLANNIIDIKKIECGGFSINKHNHNIVEVVETIFSETIDYASKKNIKMIFDTSEEEIIISADRELIQRIVLNLLSNAIKFTPFGGTIYTKVEKIKNHIVIEVKDTGIGIPKEKLDRIFHRFYQVDHSLCRDNEGSGIGLSIVKELVALHNGKIEVESEQEKGTTFKVFLPVVQEDTKKESNCQIYSNTAVSVEMADVLK